MQMFLLLIIHFDALPKRPDVIGAGKSTIASVLIEEAKKVEKM